ncbi:helix-turn-helix transcriptional regulator [Amycolatopsis cihanbeyliensis]
MSAAEAADVLKTSESTVSRYESGSVLPVWSTVLNLLRLYDATEEQIGAGIRLWEEARDEPKPVRLPSDTPKSFRRLVNAERSAPWMRTVHPYTVPGLLQTRAYVRALVAAAHRFHDPEGRTEMIVSNRMARQQCLHKDNPLRLHSLLDESVIHREIGGPAVMREQLAHLLTMGEQPNVTLQVMPYGAGAYGTMSGGCTIVGYLGDEVPGVYLEYPAGGAWVDNEQDVHRFTTMFDDATSAALAPADTADLIYQRIRATGHG